MSEQYKDQAELIEYHIKQETNKLIEKFLKDFENIRINADMEDIYLPYIFWETEKKWEGELKK